MCVYTSPAIDLLYFLNTSCSDDVDLNHRDTLLEEYLSTLKQTMSKLGCKTKPPTMAELKKSLMEREFYGALCACTILPVVLVEKSQAKGLDEIMLPDGSYNNPGYKAPLFRKVMVRKLGGWDSRKLFDWKIRCLWKWRIKNYQPEGIELASILNTKKRSKKLEHLVFFCINRNHV